MEIWKDIQGYEGIYQISNLGNVKSLSRTIYRKCGNYISKEKLLKQHVGTTGYYIVDLKKNGKRRTFKVHRLVAKAFLSELKDKPFVNHKDGDKLNNSVSNLEWCSQQENMQHAVSTGLKPAFKISKQKLKEDYIDNVMSIVQIANKYKTTKSKIWYNIKKYGLNKLDRNLTQATKYKIPLDELLNDFKSGIKNKELEAKYKCSKGIIAVRKHKFKKEGLL